MYLNQADPEIASLVTEEERRLENTIDLIAAESHASLAIMEVLGSVLNTKTIEGYPGKRFHAGCIQVDQIEDTAISRAKELFAADHANVQPHSGTSANLAVYFSVLNIGDRILSMSLKHGGHLSHGHSASITSKCFNFHHYGVDLRTEQIDYDEVHQKAKEIKPKMIVAGASAYSRLIDYKKMAEIASEVSAYFFADMAHIAGLVAVKLIPSPVPYCDFVTFTCYKTMMGGRGGVVLCKQKYAKKIDQAIFPGCQGTSAVNSIAAKAVIFKLATEELFIQTQRKTIENAAKLADEFALNGYRIVAGGTQNHQVLVDMSSKGLKGKHSEKVLEDVGLIVNSNTLPGDSDRLNEASGIRLGTSAVSVRGMGKKEMKVISSLIHNTLMKSQNKQTINSIKQEVKKLCKNFPVNKYS